MRRPLWGRPLLGRPLWGKPLWGRPLCRRPFLREDNLELPRKTWENLPTEVRRLKNKIRNFPIFTFKNFHKIPRKKKFFSSFNNVLVL